MLRGRVGELSVQHKKNKKIIDELKIKKRFFFFLNTELEIAIK